MNGDEQPPRPTATPALPWWLGRGAGAMLVLMVGALLWTLSWSALAEAGSGPTPLAPSFAGTDMVTEPVPGTPSSEEGRVPLSDPSRSTPDVTVSDPEPDPADSQDGPTDHALQAEELQRRQRERIEQAQRADQELAEFIESVGTLDLVEAWVHPLSDPYRITATFGQAGSLWSKDHTGVDLAAPTGTPVASVAAGTVTHAGDAGAYGLQVRVSHVDGTETSYGHLSRIDVTEGQLVQQGALVGAVGSTGNSTGPHLHLELRSADVAIDPVQALLVRGVAL